MRQRGDDNEEPGRGSAIPQPTRSRTSDQPLDFDHLDRRVVGVSTFKERGV